MLTCRNRSRASRRGLAPLRLSFLLGSTLAVASPAMAQGPSPDAAPATTGTDIVVTAQKRAQSILDVPIAMSAFSSDRLEKSEITELGSLQTLMPNFQISDNVSVRTIYIRGVGGGGRTVAFDTRTGVYLDGVYIGQPMAADAVLTNLERVEVLKGPQGYLYGQNTVSGAVNLVTRPPDDKVEAKAIVSYGNKDAQKLIGSFNVPLADNLYLRVGGSYQHRDGFIYDTTLRRYVDDVNDAGGRVQLRYVPDSTLTIDLSADFSSQLSHKVNGEARTNTFNTGLPAAPADQPFVIDDDFPERDVNRNWGLALIAAKDLGWGTVTSTTGYRNAYRNWNVDLDHSSADFAIFHYYDQYQTVSQELRLNGKRGNVTYVAGLFYLKNIADNDRNLEYSSQAPLIGVPAYSKIRTNPSVNNDSYAAFGALDWEFLRGLTLNTGLRFNHDVKRLTINQTSDLGPPITNIAVINGFHDSEVENSLSPTIGLTWKPGRDTMLYAKYARGVKSGGFNADYLTTDRLAGNLHLNAEKVDSFEGGVKFRTADRLLTVTGDMFYTKYSNYQVSQFRIVPNSSPPSIELALTNAGKVETWGPELSAVLAPVKGLNVDVELAWLHAKYASFPDGGGLGVDYSGHQLEYAPKFTSSVTVDYEHPVTARYSGFGHVTVSHHSSQFSDSSNAPAFFQKGYTLVDTRVGVRTENGKWEIAGYANNLFNKLYDLGTAADAFTTIFGKYGTPRTYGIELSWKY